MRTFTRSSAADKHFPLPLTAFMLLESTYDPTYGDTGPSAREFVVCQTCHALVESYDIEEHADWHEEALT